MKLLFDECIAPKAMRALAEFVALLPNPPEIRHLCELVKSSTPDEVWLATIASDPESIVITADRGASGKGFGEALPSACRRLGITFVTFSASVHRKTSAEKARALHCVWPILVSEVASAPKGSEFRLSAKDQGDYRLKLKAGPPGPS